MVGRLLIVLLPCLASGCAADLGAGASGAGAAGGAAGAAGAPAGAGSAAVTPGETTSFACDPSAKAPVAGLRRLTMNQYRNTLVDFVGNATGSLADASAVLSELSGALERLPSDRREPTSEDLHGSYRRLDQSLQQLHVDAYYDVGVAAGAALTRPERLAQVVGACAVDQDASNDAACLSELVSRLGQRALRRPL